MQTAEKPAALPPALTKPAGTVRDATIALLRSLGMTTVFGNPGSTELAFLHDWPSDFRYVLALQESSAVGMADGHAQATGSAAFVNLHSAAGVGHALGSIYTAYRNQTPLVITAGQQARSLLPLRPFLGAASAAEFPKPYVKWSCEPARPQDVPLAIAQAYAIAMQKPCGPTFVSIPADDWQVPCEPVEARPTSGDFGPDPEGLRAFANAIDASERPAIVVGAAVARDEASALAVALAERLGAAVWAAPVASRASFPEDHRLFNGFLPAAPEPLAKILGRHDLVLVLGAPAFTFHVPGDLAGLRSGPPIFHITDDADAAAAAIGGVSLLSTMRPAISSLLATVPLRDRPPATVRAPAPRIVPTEPILASFVMQTIADLRHPGSVIVEEAPSHKEALQRHLPVRDNGFYCMASGGLGFALPASVGIALARPTQAVICVIGDGSAMYSIQALWTAAQHRLPITVVVLNNGGYGAMRAFSQLMKKAAPPGIDLPGLDFPALAAGHGCAGVRVERADDLAPALSEAFASAKPRLVEVLVDRAVPGLYGLD
ncbi:benzoylformate decarboxylase [Bosea sp. 2RAB26]|uniref:benzoylformate decarboxylase n=1 Tax=Bosea sp. 2RAB26 TaxID=3237476 RepID=UPI003F8F377B